jgi:hypothetical protein
LSLGRAAGRRQVRLDHCSGIKSFSSGVSSVVVTPGIDLSSNSAVVATISGAAVGASVVRTSVDTAADSFTIFFSGPTSAAGKVAWHVFG